MKASLHNHTSYSGDDYLQKCRPELLIDKAFEIGIDILAITDTNNAGTLDNLLTRKHTIAREHDVAILGRRGMALKKGEKQLIVLRGIEFHDPKGHVLGIGMDRPIEYNPHYSTKDLIASIHDSGGIAIPSHILNTYVGGMSRDTLYSVKDLVDAVETFNAQNIRFLPYIADLSQYNRQAKKLAKELGIPGIAAPDSHVIHDIDSSYVTFNSLSTANSLVESMRSSLKNGTYKNHERNVPLKSFADWAILRHFKNTGDATSFIEYSLKGMLKRS